MVSYMEGILTIYYHFLRYLRKHNRKTAYLQLTGRIEDYLVKEFIAFAHQKGIFAISNYGKKNQQRVDICLLKGTHKKPIIYGMIEAKYLRNVHRAWSADATDENVPSLKSLKRQLHIFNKPTQGRFGVKLNAHSSNIYGMVFASFVNQKKDTAKKKLFYDSILEKAEPDFRYHDLPKPYFTPVYDDIKIKALDATFYVTLKCGLWNKKER